MVALVLDLSRQELITLENGAIVTRPQGKKIPKTKQLADLTGNGAPGCA